MTTYQIEMREITPDSVKTTVLAETFTDHREANRKLMSLARNARGATLVQHHAGQSVAFWLRGFMHLTKGYTEFTRMPVIHGGF